MHSKDTLPTYCVLYHCSYYSRLLLYDTSVMTVHDKACILQKLSSGIEVVFIILYALVTIAPVLAISVH